MLSMGRDTSRLNYKQKNVEHVEAAVLIIDF